MHDFSPVTTKIQFPGPEGIGKVAGILRSCSCGVKRKYTIPSGMVAERFLSASLGPLPGAKKNGRAIVFLPLQPFRACPQSLLPLSERKGMNTFDA